MNKGKMIQEEEERERRESGRLKVEESIFNAHVSTKQ